jgi:hypothetical protein
VSFVALLFHLATPVAPLGLTVPPSAEIQVQLTEWKVELSSASVPAGPVRFIVHNGGSIPHGFEVEGRGLEKEIELIAPGASDTLEVTLKAGHYEIYCPVGGNSHKKLGMDVEFIAADGGTTPPGMTADRDGEADRVDDDALGEGDRRGGRWSGNSDPARPLPLPRQRGTGPQGLWR